MWFMFYNLNLFPTEVLWQVGDSRGRGTGLSQWESVLIVYVFLSNKQVTSFLPSY